MPNLQIINLSLTIVGFRKYLNGYNEQDIGSPVVELADGVHHAADGPVGLVPGPRHGVVFQMISKK